MPEKIHVITNDILNVLPEMTFFVSGDGVVMETNTEAVKTLDVMKNVLIHAPFSSFLKEAFKEHFRYSLEQCIRTGKNNEFEVEMQDADGKQVDVLLHLSRYPAEADPEHALVFIFARDISKERKKEMDLLRFANVAHYTVNPLEITGVDGKIIYVNPAFEEASGYSKEEIIGKNPNFFSSGKQPKSFWQKMWTTITSGEVWMGEVENRRRNGDPFLTHLLISPIVNDRGKIVGYFGIHRDITEQKHLEQMLTQAQKMESIGMLAAGIAHEVGNPLASISSLAQVLQRTVRENDVKEKLELIKSQVTRISRIIRDLVDFSRRTNYTLMPTDINKTLNEAVAIVQVGKKAKSVSFNLVFDENLPQLTLVPDQIHQVFINILINAVDAILDQSSAVTSDIKPEELKPKVISVATGVKNDNVIVTFSDSGKGIAEEDIPKIFEPFFTTKKVGEGTGLGLWVSYGIVKNFGGDIFVESKKESGTTFKVILPVNQQI